MLGLAFGSGTARAIRFLERPKHRTAYELFRYQKPDDFNYASGLDIEKRSTGVDSAKYEVGLSARSQGFSVLCAKVHEEPL